MKAQATVSQAQIDRFRDIKRPCKNETIPPNFRPVQENTQPLYSCGDQDGGDSDDTSTTSAPSGGGSDGKSSSNKKQKKRKKGINFYFCNI